MSLFQEPGLWFPLSLKVESFQGRTLSRHTMLPTALLVPMLVWVVDLTCEC